jgi:NADH:quinone reductase (non-electrogenic)
MIETRLTRLLGIAHPIVCGAMHLATSPELVAAVAEAGALGLLNTTGYRTCDELQDGVRRTKSLTGRPFGVNINLFPGDRPATVEEFIGVLHAERVPVIETSGRSPKDYVELIKAEGAVFMHKVARVRDGVAAARMGADVVTMVGYESGGHPGEDDVSLLVQVQALLSAVDVPVVAADGVVGGRGLAAMLALGAEGVCMGTRFLATKECPVHENVKRWIVDALPTDTVIVERSLRNSMRVARTATALEVVRMDATPDVLAGLRGELEGDQMREAMFDGRIAETGLVCSGQSAGLVADVPSVRELVERTVAEAETCMARLGSLVRGAPEATL